MTTVPSDVENVDLPYTNWVTFPSKTKDAELSTVQAPSTSGIPPSLLSNIVQTLGHPFRSVSSPFLPLPTRWTPKENSPPTFSIHLGSVSPPPSLSDESESEDGMSIFETSSSASSFDEDEDETESIKPGELNDGHIEHSITLKGVVMGMGDEGEGDSEERFGWSTETLVKTSLDESRRQSTSYSIDGDNLQIDDEWDSSFVDLPSLRRPFVRASPRFTTRFSATDFLHNVIVAEFRRKQKLEFQQREWLREVKEVQEMEWETSILETIEEEEGERDVEMGESWEKEESQK